MMPMVNEKNIVASPTLNVAAVYEGQIIFITGATGYIGALVLENILRTCPGVKKIYIAIREKKGKPPAERLQQLLSTTTFLKLQNGLSTILPKLEVLSVDFGQDQCGISKEKLEEMAEEVNFVIHCAAAIQFDLTISEALAQNYAPARELLDLAVTWRNLRCWCYMSSAFVNLNISLSMTENKLAIEEKIYDLKDAKGDLIDGMQLADKWMSMTPDEAQADALKFMRENRFQNTYVLSKNLTERLVMSYGEKGVNVCITRPSLVTSVAGDPLPGYIGNSAGITAIMLGAAYGIFSHIPQSENNPVLVVPGDLVSQGTVVAVAAVATGAKQKIYHMCTSHSFPIMVKDFYGVVMDALQLDPPRKKTLRAKSAEYKLEYLGTKRECDLYNVMQGRKIQSAVKTAELQGDQSMANKLRIGWAAWEGFNLHWKDMTFYSDGIDKLQAMLTGEEALSLKCIWKEELGDQWDRYVRTYTAGVAHRYLGVDPDAQFFHMHDYRPPGCRLPV